jgi:hypothetical protein
MTPNNLGNLRDLQSCRRPVRQGPVRRQADRITILQRMQGCQSSILLVRGNIGADFFQDDLFDLLREALRDFQVS